MSSRSAGGTGPSGGKRIEVLHTWEGELADEKEVFEARNPGVRIESTIDDNISLEMKRRLLKRDPPDLWIEWPGPNLRPYDRVGALGDATDVWTSTDMDREFYEAAKEGIYVEGAYRAVPLGINRINLLFYNVEMFERAGVVPGRISDPREFVEALAQVEDAVAVDPIVVGYLQQFASTGLQLWESLYLGLHGPDAYRKLLEGDAEPRREEVRDALSLLDSLLEYANEDAINTTLSQEGERFHEGEAACHVQGIWDGYSTEEFAYGSEWDCVAVPGTSGVPTINQDALVLRADPEHPEETRRFLEYVGSAERVRGAWEDGGLSIPPRKDVPTDGFSEFLLDQVRAFERADDYLPSIAHGLGVEPETLIDLRTPFSDFPVSRDVRGTTDELVSAFAEAGSGRIER